jgi:carboxylesterase type B
MSSYLATCITTGNPNGPGLPRWPACSPGSPTVMEVGEHYGPMPVASPEKLGFWKRYFATQDAW